MMVAAFRTLSVAALLVGLVLFGFWRLTVDQQRLANEQLRALNEEMRERLAEHEEMIGRLSRTRRLARVTIDDQTRRPDGTVGETRLQLIELDDDGGELARQSFELPGDEIFVDAWTVKFEHEAVAMGHPLLGRTLILLRRLYSDRMAPQDGIAIDTPGAVPPGYAGSDVSRFEQKIWESFWDIASDRALAASYGVRVAQGEAVYQRVRTGQFFDLVVDAAGGMSLMPAAASTDETAPAGEAARVISG